MAVATFAFMVVAPLLLGWMVWTQFDLVFDRARMGHFSLLGAIRSVLSATIAVIFAWLFWGTIIKVWLKRRTKKRGANAQGKNA